MKNIVKVVLTGGPCAGKSSALREIQQYFIDNPYDNFRVIFVPETASELISGGVNPLSCGGILDYQILQMKLHEYQEDIFERAAHLMREENILIICDRGQPDCMAYMTKDDYREAASALGCSESDLFSRYDAVFHLETVAKNYPELYMTDNNKARTETFEEAVELDDKLLEAYKFHPSRFIVRSEESFHEKVDCLIETLIQFLRNEKGFLTS